MIFLQLERYMTAMVFAADLIGEIRIDGIKATDDMLALAESLVRVGATLGDVELPFSADGVGQAVRYLRSCIRQGGAVVAGITRGSSGDLQPVRGLCRALGLSYLSWETEMPNRKLISFFSARFPAPLMWVMPVESKNGAPCAQGGSRDLGGLLLHDQFDLLSTAINLGMPLTSA
jgi:hypothetical protein